MQALAKPARALTDGGNEELSAISTDDIVGGGPGDLARLHITTEGPDGRIVVGSLSGEVDQSNANALLKALAGAVPNTAIGVVVDCTNLRYVDSAGVYIVFTLARRLEAHQQRLAVAATPGSHVEQVLRLTEVQQVAGRYPTRQEAIDALAE